MRNLSILIVCVFVLSCNQHSAISDSPSRDSVYFPFAPIYSNAFEKGNDSLAFKVLSVWRAFENGDVRKMGAVCSDSLRIILPEQIFTGEKDSVLEAFDAYRKTFGTMQCFIYSWMPVHVRDQNDDLVFVWGLYDGTKPNGDRDYSLVHETWRFDQQGRIREMEQFRTHPH